MSENDTLKAMDNCSCNCVPVIFDTQSNGVVISVTFCESESYSDVRSAILELLTSAYEQRLRDSV